MGKKAETHVAAPTYIRLCFLWQIKPVTWPCSFDRLISSSSERENRNEGDGDLTSVVGIEPAMLQRSCSHVEHIVGLWIKAQWADLHTARQALQNGMNKIRVLWSGLLYILVLVPLVVPVSGWPARLSFSDLTSHSVCCKRTRVNKRTAWKNSTNISLTEADGFIWTKNVWRRICHFSYRRQTKTSSQHFQNKTGNNTENCKEWAPTEEKRHL